jgi:hypothetical protein
LAPGQVAAYVGGLADEIADPAERIVEALTKARSVSGQQWKDLRDALSDDIGRLVGGSDADQAQAIGDKVVQLLIVARGLKPEEFKKQKPELEKVARQIVGEAGPFEVLRHVMEGALAEMLSNPQLTAAIDLRLATK